MNIAIDINDIIRNTTEQFKITYCNRVNTNFKIDMDDIDSYDMMEVFPFSCREDLNNFKEDFSFEIYGRGCMMKDLQSGHISNWIYNVLYNLDDEDIPKEIMLFSPMETPLNIQATLNFLSVNMIKLREYIFPVDSMTIYDKADIVITTNPRLIENVPNDKFVIKVNTPYNKDIKADYSFDSLLDIIRDKDETIIKILEKKITKKN